MARKTYNEKLNSSGDLPKIEIITDPKMIARYGGERMLIASALCYDGIMKRVPFGKLITSVDLRIFFAARHGADFTCPLTAGIFINIATHAAAERNMSDTSPYHRTLRKDGELNEKFPGGIDAHRAMLEVEGHEIFQKGKRFFVHEYQKAIWVIN